MSGAVTAVLKGDPSGGVIQLNLVLFFSMDVFIFLNVVLFINKEESFVVRVGYMFGDSHKRKWSQGAKGSISLETRISVCHLAQRPMDILFN